MSYEEQTTIDLILWRHAEAEDGDGNTPDAKRRLTARGEKQARKMAAWLTARLPHNATVLVSPTERTQQTMHSACLSRSNRASASAPTAPTCSQPLAG